LPTRVVVGAVHHSLLLLFGFILLTLLRVTRRVVLHSRLFSYSVSCRVFYRSCDLLGSVILVVCLWRRLILWLIGGMSLPVTCTPCNWLLINRMACTTEFRCVIFGTHSPRVVW
jgi:hypothetical protein